jgi:hypothetical protein
MNSSYSAYYVKIDNINVPEYLKIWKKIEARTGKELLYKVYEYYGFNMIPIEYIQLWSKQKYIPKGIRLDNIENIPKEYEFIWIRGVK